MDAAITYLRSPLAVRARCENVLACGLEGGLSHFAVDLARLGAAADVVVEVTRAAYPTLDIPVHGRLNHFGADRVASLRTRLAEPARALIDLVVVSVLVDAGAGDAWRFHDVDGTTLSRSEGLAVASLRAFEAGVFSSDRKEPLRADAAGLRAIDDARLADAFQVTADNPLVGVAGRAELLRKLGDALHAPWFPGGRPGGLIDSLGSLSHGGAVAAAEILGALLDGLGEIWPGRIVRDGVNLGDVWPHPAAGGEGPSTGLVPFHKLSQWLAYSLFEPLEEAGLQVSQPGALTGLPEYRNGGLLLDTGVLVPRGEHVLGDLHRPGDEVVVEWRALTVALLDRVADAVRERLGKTAAELPLARILEGGTWAAGRKLAAERRGGKPPMRIESDGTVF